MGWKKFKEAYEIHHTVHIEGDQAYISSDFVHGMVRINVNTGEVVEHGGRAILGALYPRLLNAPRSEIVRLLAEPDEFTQSIPVFLVEDSLIMELQCEELNAMQVTHDGVVIKGHFSDTHQGAAAMLLRKLRRHVAQDAASVIEAQHALDRAVQRHVESTSALTDALGRYPEPNDEA